MSQTKSGIAASVHAQREDAVRIGKEAVENGDGGVTAAGKQSQCLGTSAGHDQILRKSDV